MPLKPKFRREYLPPQDHLAAIGSIAVLWTAIESIMELTILGLYEIDMGRGLVLTANLSFHARMSLLRILAGENVHMDTAQSAEMTTILNRVDQCFGDRNTIIHGLWGPAEAPSIVRRMSVRARGKKLQAASQSYKAADLWTISDRLAILLRDFTDLSRRLGTDARLAEAPRHSRSTSPPKSAAK